MNKEDNKNKIEINNIINEAFDEATRVLNEKKNRVVETVYHYSNIEALYNGILARDTNNHERAISLFATDSRYLNDKTEMEYGNQKIKTMLYLSGIEDFTGDMLGGSSKSYLTSFSTEPDSIPMWSTYGKKGDGIAFGFDYNILKKSLVSLLPCIYNDNDLIDFIKTIVKYMQVGINTMGIEIYDVMYGFSLGYILCFLEGMIKNEGYSYENEYRYIGLYSENIKYRYSNNLIIPYTPIYLPKKALKSITIGPNLDMDKTTTSIREYIDSLGFKDVEIIHSKVPFRNL